VKGHSRRQELVKDKISELEGKIEIKKRKNRRTISQTTQEL
jgi:hypothetical protein